MHTNTQCTCKHTQTNTKIHTALCVAKFPSCFFARIGYHALVLRQRLRSCHMAKLNRCQTTFPILLGCFLKLELVLTGYTASFDRYYSKGKNPDPSHVSGIHLSWCEFPSFCCIWFHNKYLVYDLNKIIHMLQFQLSVLGTEQHMINSRRAVFEQ